MHSFTLWENDTFTVSTPMNPHIPYSEGLHVIVAPRQATKSAWQDVDLAAETFRLASTVCKTMEELQLAPWFNLQANGNWGLLPGGTPFFHVHVYGRNKTGMWGKPVVLPEAPGTYHNQPMPEAERSKLSDALKVSLKALDGVS